MSVFMSFHLAFKIKYFILKNPPFFFFWVVAFVQAFTSCGKQGLLFIVVSGLPIAVDFLVSEHRL